MLVMDRSLHNEYLMTKLSLLLALAVAACGISDDDSDQSDEKSDFTFPTSHEYTQWRYQGAMPQMRDLEIVVSRDGRTMRVEGRPFVPEGSTPLEMHDEDGVAAQYWPAEGQDLSDEEIEGLIRNEGLNHLYKNEETGKWYVVYPVAVGVSQFSPGYNKFDLVVPRRSSTATSPNGHTWHQFPYIGYKGGRYGAGTVAFHTPYTTISWNGRPRGPAPIDSVLHVFRGRVSIACKRMAPEHVLEFAHLLGIKTDVKSSGRLGQRRSPFSDTLVDQVNKRGDGNFIHSISGWDSIAGVAVDVNYPTYGPIRIPDERKVHNTWDAADEGKLNWVQYRDEREPDGWLPPPNPSDPFDSQVSSADYEHIEIINPLPDDHPDADTQ